MVNMNEEQPRPKKRRCFADIVFLIDATQSMQPFLGQIKVHERITALLHDFKLDYEVGQDDSGEWLHDSIPAVWRAKVVGYRDFTDGTAPLLEDNPFVHNDAAALKSQLEALQVQGEDKGPSSLLDAIYHAATMDQTERGEPLSPNKWRYRSDGTRFVIIFTDADCHPTTRDGGTFDDIVNACHSNRIVLIIVAPEMDCYDTLCEIDKAEYEPIEVQSGEEPAEALARMTSDPDFLKWSIRQTECYSTFFYVDEDKYFLLNNRSERKGPLSKEQLRAHWKSGKIPAGTLCCTKGMDTWKPIETFGDIVRV